MPKDVKKLGQSLTGIQWYEIGGQVFYQDTLTIGQTLLLIPYLNGMSFESLQSEEVLKQLGDQLGEVLQIVLVPQGMTQQEHIAELNTPGKVERGAFFLQHITHIDLMGLYDDFFVCNLDSSFLNQLTQGIQGLLKNTIKAPLPTNTSESLPLSPGETPLIVPESLASSPVS